MTPRETVEWFLANGYPLVFWPAVGDIKGPTEKDWTTRTYTIADYTDGDRVGTKLGSEISPGHWLHDIDIDWAPGALIARNLLPPTGLVYGRPSKRYSHAFYTLPEGLPSFRYDDVDGSALIEIRGTTRDGRVGLQTMMPPSVWSKNGTTEPLVFIGATSVPSHLPQASHLKQRVCLVAIGMILAKHLGKNGFGHDARLAWAGYLLRAGIPPEDLVTMGEAMSAVCTNDEVADVRRVVQSTVNTIAADKPTTKVKGGPTLAAILGADGKKILDRINEWLGRDSDFIRNKKGILADNQENIKRAVRLLGHELAYNEFADKLLLDKEPMEDRQINELWLKIDEEYRFRPTAQFFEKVVKRLAWMNPFHPVKEYLVGLEWDGEPRLDTWLMRSAGAKDSPYLRAVSAIVLIAAVRRIKDPGCKYDEMLVLESAQGLNKSSALRALCPNGEWFSDDFPLNVTSQRLIEATLGKWIIEAADLAGKRKSEVEQLKAMMSRGTDGPTRLAYAHLPVERPRQFILLGTTNSAAYLVDPTGARRFWPVAVKAFDVPWIHANRDQLWAEAVARELRGDSIRLPEELWPSAAEEQERRREVDMWEDPIRSACIKIAPDSANIRRVTTGALYDALGIPVERRDRASGMRLTEIMIRLGFRRATVRLAGSEAERGFITERSELLELPETDDTAESTADVLKF